MALTAEQVGPFVGRYVTVTPRVGRKQSGVLRAVGTFYSVNPFTDRNLFTAAQIADLYVHEDKEAASGEA